MSRTLANDLAQLKEQVMEGTSLHPFSTNRNQQFALILDKEMGLIGKIESVDQGEI